MDNSLGALSADEMYQHQRITVNAFSLDQGRHGYAWTKKLFMRLEQDREAYDRVIVIAHSDSIKPETRTLFLKAGAIDATPVKLGTTAGDSKFIAYLAEIGCLPAG